MKISELVKGETIKLDNHNSGQPISIDDKGLHLHKRFNHKSKYRGKVDVLIPLNVGEIIVRVAEGTDSDKIIREIKKVFSDKKTRDKFVGEIKDALNDLSSAGYKQNGNELLDSGRHEKIDKAIVKVAEQFGMSKKDVAEYLYENEYQITKKFKFPYNSKTGRRNFPEVLYIRADLLDISFLISSSRYMIEEDMNG